MPDKWHLLAACVVELILKTIEASQDARLSGLG
jgi:hypothetical protein